MNTNHTSQLSKFYKRSLQERIDIIASWLNVEHVNLSESLSISQADNMIENAVGIYSLPFGIATNFLINRRDYLIPMVIEEPSVVAALSFAAKLVRVGGGFITSSDNPIMIGQVQVLDVPDIPVAIEKLEQHKRDLLAKVDAIGGSIVKRGGGARDIVSRVLSHPLTGELLIVHLHYDVRDAMGANAINTAVEHIAPDIEAITGGRVHLKILSNLTDQRKASATCVIPSSALATDNTDGVTVARSIVEASVFAEVDPYRATTHNKGIMNGIDAVVIATGNDWRAVEAGAHAFAARSGSYTSLSQWRQNEAGDLVGSIELPLAVGIVGGATRVHPTAQIAMQILGVQSAQELSEVIAAVGLAQNLAAIRALSTEGIQQGHMRMHARQLAVAAGATPEMVSSIVEQLIREGNIRLERATALVQEYLEKRKS
jgi:hydroxymethylglutaryl-CoA reductase